MKIEIIRWVIMDDRRRVIAKGVPRNRHLIPVDKDDGKRVIYYGTKRKAESAFKIYRFYNNYDPDTTERIEYKLESVPVKITIEEISEEESNK